MSSADSFTQNYFIFVHIWFILCLICLWKFHINSLSLTKKLPRQWMSIPKLFWIHFRYALLLKISLIYLKIVTNYRIYVDKSWHLHVINVMMLYIYHFNGATGVLWGLSWVGQGYVGKKVNKSLFRSSCVRRGWFDSWLYFPVPMI